MAYFQVPSGWRRTTSADLSSLGSPPGMSSRQWLCVSARSPLTTVDVDTMVIVPFVSRKPWSAARNPVASERTAPGAGPERTTGEAVALDAAPAQSVRR
jgi:hypothetical protein